MDGSSDRVFVQDNAANVALVYSQNVYSFVTNNGNTKAQWRNHTKMHIINHPTNACVNVYSAKSVHLDLYPTRILC